MQEVIVGWDGVSNPIVRLRDECGCEYLRDGKTLMSVCTPCLTVAAQEQSEADFEDTSDHYPPTENSGW